MTEQPKPKRRWFRFSLKTLMLVVVLLSLPLGWFAMKMVRAERQRQAVEAIEEAGGVVFYEYHYKGGALTVGAKPSGPAWLRQLVGEDFFWEAVNVDFFTKGYVARADDMVLEDVKGLTGLKGLVLSCAPVTDAGLEQLKGLTALESLSLGRTQVTDSGLENLKEMTNLESLDLTDTQVTAEGIERLQKALPNCQIYR